jgi:hypothetical protein
MKTITNVTNGKGFRSTVSITREYKLTPEHFKVLDVLINDDYTDIYKGAKTGRAKQIRYNAVRTLGDMGILGTHLEDDVPSHFMTGYGIEIAKKIVAAGYKK